MAELIANDQNVINLIVVGKAGEGKSTFLGELAGKPELFKTGRSTESVTQDVQIEEIVFKNIKLRIIDIPGLLDGRCSLTRWLALLQQKIGDIKLDGILIVTKSQNIRVDASVLILAACVNSFFENFKGDSACLVFTHCDQQPMDHQLAKEYMSKLCSEVKIKNIIQNYVSFEKGNKESLNTLQQFIQSRIQARNSSQSRLAVNQKPDFQQVIDVMNDQYGDEVFESVLQQEIANMKREFSEKLDQNNQAHAQQLSKLQQNISSLENALKNAQNREKESRRRNIFEKVLGWFGF